MRHHQMAKEILEAGILADGIQQKNPEIQRLEAMMIAYKIQNKKKKKEVI